jgi:hypothetical protein
MNQLRDFAVLNERIGNATIAGCERKKFHWLNVAVEK